MKVSEEQPTKTEHVASIISGTGKSRMTAAAKAISYRVPISTLARVDAMAGQAGNSRNAMLNLLLDVALEEVGHELSEEVFQALQIREIGHLRQMLEEGTESISE